METGNAEPTGHVSDGACVVRVAVTRHDGRTSTGTGCLIDRQARVATCAHVVDDASELRVYVVGYPKAWRYVVLRASVDDDVAILEPEGKVAGAPLHAPLHPDWKHDVDVGDAVSAWGYSSFENFETEAQRFACTISAFSANTGLIGLNATINPGDSGGPIFDERHRVIGIVAARDPERQGQAMGIPVSLVLRLATDLLDLEPVDAPAARIAGDLPTSDRGYPVLGRDELLERLKGELIAGHHQSLVVLPGIGKTTIATILVNDPAVAAHFDGILWANVGRKFNVEAQLRGWVGLLGISLASLKDSADQVEALKAATKQAIGTRRMLMVLDDVWEASAAEAFMSLGRNCVFLSTTREIDIATDLLKGPKWVAVRPLPIETGHALLTAIAPGAVTLDAAATRALVDAVSGLPLALVLIGKYLAANDWGDPAQLRFALDRMSRAGERLKLAVAKERSLWSIIDVSYAALGDESLQQAFLALSIFRPDPHAFTAEMAEHICDVARDAFQPLHNMGLIEFRQAPKAEGDDGEDGYTMHRVLAEFGRDRLANRSSLEIPRLHAKAVRYYAARMNEDIEHDPAAYLSKYRFEDRDWQRLKEAWLYHLAQTGDTVVALRAFLRVWFEAFWWWGYYQRFPFCGRLVTEWGSREIEDRARVGLAGIATFEASYPAGYDKRAGGDWTKVRDVLVAMRGRMRLDGPIESLPDEDARLVRAFTEFFLAEATGYGTAHDVTAALALYESAHALFVASQASWEATWALFYIAQFLQDQGDAERALPYCRRSLEEALGVADEADVDPELLANGYRLLGELVVGSDASATFDAWHHAVFYAYAFQAYPQRADSYTLAFYDEITSRIAGSLIALHGTGDAGAAQLVSRLQASWVASDEPQPVASALGDAAALAKAIFPSDASPAVDDVARVVAAVERIRASLPDARLPSRETSSATPASNAGASNTVNRE